MKIAIIGSGSIARRHFFNIKKLKPEADIIVLTRPLNIQSKKKLFKDEANFVSTLEEVIEFSPIIAVICSPANFHVQQSSILSEENIHLFIEKPLSDKIHGIDSLLISTEKNKTINMVGYPLRFNSSLLFFRKVAQSMINDPGALIESKCLSFLPDWRPGLDYRKSVSAKKSLGGGALLELSHEIDYLKWIFGEISLIDSKIHRKGNLEIDVEDSADLVFRLNNYRKIKANLSLDFSSNFLSRECMIKTKSRELKWDGISNQVLSRSKSSDNWKIIYENDNQDMYFEEIKYFLNCVEKNLTAQPDIIDALGTLKIILEAKEQT